jgi:WD40 repeat protein/tRNA A-37 threonylcarbamoyl transferase component Bud32
MLGKTLSGRYKIVKHLGGGGFGQTYFAEDLQLPGNPLCVIKQLKPKTTDPLALQIARRLFDREAQVLYTLGNHNQIPQLLAHFEEEQEFYLAQECIEGNDLKEELPFGQLWSETQVITLLQDILKILEFVHQQNVIHRDIKPANLIRRKQDGKIVLIDFGAVKQVSAQTTSPEGHTTLTVAIGSPGYMPNEQLGGKPQFCSDIYAVGMLGIQALTGFGPNQLPEDPKTSEILWRDKLPTSPNLRLPPRSTGNGNTAGEGNRTEQTPVTPELADILDKMVRYDYRQRYQTATEALEALQQLTNPNPSSAMNPDYQVSLTSSDSKGKADSTVAWPPPPQASPSSLDSTLEPTLPSVELTQAPASGQQTASDSSANPSEPQVGLQTLAPDVSTSRNKSTQLMSIGAGIATALALTVGLYYFHASSLSKTESQWAQKISLSSTLTGDSTYVNPVAMTPNGQTLATGGDDGTIRLWDVRTGKLRSTLKGHSSGVYAVAISQDGQILASGSADETIKIWNLETGQQLRTLSKDSKGIRSLAINPDNQTLVSGDATGMIEIWNLGTGERLNFFSGHTILVTSLAISPDGKTLVSSSTDKTIKLWELKSGALIHTLTDDKSRPILAVAINPKGETFVSSGVDGAIRLWDLRTGKLIQTLSAGLGAIYSLAYRRNGQTLVSGGGGGTIRLWDLQTGKPLRTLSGHSDDVNSLTISADGETLVSSSQDKTIRIWRSP